jgi:hypothetical protein
MKKSIIILFVIAVGLLIFTYPTTGARAFAVTAINEVGVEEARYAELLSYAEAKRDWVSEEMAGEQGFLQTESLRIEVRELKRIHNEYAKSFNMRYTLFTRLGLI